MISLKKNEIYSVTIEDLTSEANGVCHINGCAVFVPRALPGEEWEIKIVKAASDRAYARRGSSKLLPAASNPPVRITASAAAAIHGT